MREASSRAGRSTRAMAKKRHTSAAWIGLCGVIGMIVLALLVHNAKAVGLSGIGVLVVLVLMIFLRDFTQGRVDRKISEEKRAWRGARGEERVGEILEGLGEDFLVMHDVLSPYGNIDHLVLSPSGGVFLLETKSHHGRVEGNSGQLLLNGHLPEKDFVAQALGNALWLRGEIGKIVGAPPWITPVLVFTNAFVVPCSPIQGVRIINKRYLTQTVSPRGQRNELDNRLWQMRDAIERQLMGNG